MPYLDIEKKRARAKSFALQRSHRAGVAIWDYKSTHPCVDCGESDPLVLDFDHRDGATKKFNVHARQVSLEILMAEIAKCDVRCANCHRRVTAKAQGWFKNVEQWRLELEAA